ncbi:hypothetical protein NM688_g8707 [Phlebia brevispora]|uniref:Uncharacterized protein n=1 Tax=Phlebia brevispora TaxID=194682 RepID=A0ACC1RQ05_9APHY|nr:hypothetical protein NM688_g8707 [Phlebia brevispora]
MRSTPALLAFAFSATFYLAAAAAPPKGGQMRPGQVERYSNVVIQNEDPPAHKLCPSFEIPHNDLRISVSHDHFKGGDVCGQRVEIEVEGKNYEAVVAGECEMCHTNGLGIEKQSWDKIVGDKTGWAFPSTEGSWALVQDLRY